jgi:hypothetical protein
MTTPGSWSETAAGLIRNQGLQVEPPFEAQRREFASSEHRQAVAEFQAAVDRDPNWKFIREVQRQLTEQGRGPSTVIAIADTRPPELKALWHAHHAAEARTGLWKSGQPANDTAREMDEHQRRRIEAARLREAAANLRLPPGYPR